MSLICALAQPFMGVTTIPAIILGHMARGQIRRTGEDGDGLATAGLVLGWVGLGVAMLLILLIAAHAGQGPQGQFPASPSGGCTGLRGPAAQRLRSRACSVDN